MAGKLIIDTLQTEASFLQLNVASNLIATMNANGIYSTTGTKMIGTDGSVGAATIANTAITGTIITTQIADGAVTNAKIDTVANTKITGLITTSQLANNLTVNASSIISSANIDFKVGASQNTAFRIEDTGQLYNSIESTTGTDYRGTLYAGYMCRAWVNFNGTGTVAIRASGNVSSITDNGTGDYTVNFTTAMPDANYAFSSLTGSTLVGADGFGARVKADPTSTALQVLSTYGNTAYDIAYFGLAIFR